jgi:ribosomal protein S15
VVCHTSEIICILRIPTSTAGHGSTASPSTHICRTFASTPVDQASAVHQKRRHRDPYALAQARARKAANISRQEVLEQERSSALGDPVRGVPTPFVQSFETAIPSTPTPSSTNDTHAATRNESASPKRSPSGPNAQSEEYKNFYLTQREIKDASTRSEKLTASTADQDFFETNDPEEKQRREQERQQHDRERKQKHATATEALNRIVSLSNGSSKDRLRVNIQRCVDAFGRHQTDKKLPPKPPVAASILLKNPSANTQKVERAGPDTGSSEVQIAILTAKIKTLADFLESRGRPDKINKRNLTILVHKRQKLLQYLRRKERGGPRWQHLIETLGLTEGTWRGEISLR